MQEMLLALLVDGVNMLVWQNTKDGHKGRNRPQSVFKKITEPPEKKEEQYTVFRSVEDFEKWHKEKMNHV